ncbi:MAG: hypothetical protein INR64_08430, partial [Caulobacteraceae bacterium]|nr:hypothetical protein [Caulobacter sp.]
MSEDRAAPSDPAPASGDGPRRLKRWELWSLVGAGALAVLLVLGAIVGVLLGRAPRLVAAYAAARLHRPVHIDGASAVRLLPGGAEVTFHDAHIGRPKWAGPGDALSVGFGRLRVPWTSILHLQPQASLLELDRPVVRMTRDAQGRPDWASGPGAGSLSEPIAVQRLRITDGRLLYADAEH